MEQVQKSKPGMSIDVDSKKTGKQSLFFQPKLTINHPNDIYEQEADAVAKKIMRMPDKNVEPLFFQPESIPITPIQKKCAACEQEEKLQRKEDEEEEPLQMKASKEFHIQRECSHCEEEEEKKLQMKGENSSFYGNTAPPIVNDVFNSGGQPIDAGTRNFMESRFGYDFGNVKIHNDPLAHQSSKEINALAYTHNNHIVFGAGQYNPHTYSGRQLLAHELTHSIQQNVNKTDGVQRWYIPVPVYPKWKKDQIRHVQRALRDLGLYKGDTTGIIDDQTVKGLNSWFGQYSWSSYAYREAISLLKAGKTKTKAPTAKAPDISETSGCTRGTPSRIFGRTLYFNVDSVDFNGADQVTKYNEHIHDAFWAKNIEIHGYASIEGPTTDYNFDLACRRAITIRDKFRKGGITAPISLISHGPTKAFGPDVHNRNVVIKLVMPSLSKNLTIISWINPDNLQDFSKAMIAFTPSDVRPIAAVSMLLKCTANKRPPSKLSLSDLDTFKQAKEFRAIQHYSFELNPDGGFNVVSSQIPGYTAPSKCGCDDVPPCSYLLGETSPLNYVKKTFPEIDALMKFRVSAKEEEEAIQKKPSVPVALGGLSLDMLPRVPWVWTHSIIAFKEGSSKLKWLIQGSKFPTHTIYVDGLKVGEIKQEHPLSLFGNHIRTADQPRQTLQEEEAQRNTMLGYQDDTVRPGGFLSGEG